MRIKSLIVSTWRENINCHSYVLVKPNEMLNSFFLLSLLTPLVGEEDTEEEEEEVMEEEEEEVMEVEEVMEEEVVVMEEEAMEEVVVMVEAMEGVGVATFKDHKGSLHQVLASHPVQG